MKSLIDEIRLQRKLLKCANVIRIIKVYEDQKYLCLLLELKEGGSLYDLICKQNKLKEDDSKIITAQILLAADYFHQRQILHRDLKPNNILIFNNSANQKEVTIADFGFAMDLSKVQKENQPICGTVGYHSPEVLRLEKYSEKSDIFSIGVVLYNMITGRCLFDGRNRDEIVIKNRRYILPDSFQRGISHYTSEAKDFL